MKLGFIGMGNMGLALAEGFLHAGLLSPTDLSAFAPNREKLQKNATRIGFIPCDTAREAVIFADVVVMACKPQQIEGVLDELGDALRGKALLSVALGWDYARYAAHLPDTRIQFVMPNTPAAIGEGVFLFEEQNSLKAEEKQALTVLFEALGTVITCPLI